MRHVTYQERVLTGRVSSKTTTTLERRRGVKAVRQRFWETRRTRTQTTRFESEYTEK
jgi:hypothetical protein